MSQSDEDHFPAGEADRVVIGHENGLKAAAAEVQSVEEGSDELIEGSAGEDVVFVMEVSRKGGLCDYIFIRHGDDPEELARAFVRNHKLSEKYVKKIAESLRAFYQESMRRHIHNARFEIDPVSSGQSAPAVGSVANRSHGSVASDSSTIDRTSALTRMIASPELRGTDNESYGSSGAQSVERSSSRESFDSNPAARVTSLSTPDYVLSPFSNGSNIHHGDDTMQRSHIVDTPCFISSPAQLSVLPRQMLQHSYYETSQHHKLDSLELRDDYEEQEQIGDYEDSEKASKAAFNRAKAASIGRDYSVGYLSDPEILTGRSTNRRRGSRRKKAVKRAMAVYSNLHRDAEVRQLKIDRMRKRLEMDAQQQLSQWRMTDASKQWLRNQSVFSDNSSTTERLYNDYRLMQERRQEYAQARQQEQLPSWSCPKCGKENLGSSESCMTIAGMKRPLMEQNGPSWVYSRKLDEKNIVYCGQPRPAAFQPTLLIVPPVPQQRHAGDVFSNLYSKRDNREHAVARYREAESANNFHTFHPTVNSRSEMIIKRRRSVSHNKHSVAASTADETADVETNSQQSSVKKPARPSSAPARVRQRPSHRDVRDFDAELHEALYKDAADRTSRLQQLREIHIERPSFQPQVNPSPSVPAQAGHDQVFDRLHQASLHLKKHRQELEAYQEVSIDPETGQQLFAPKLISKQIPRAVSNIETHLSNAGQRMKQHQAEKEKAIHEEMKKRAATKHTHATSVKISDSIRRKEIAEAYQLLLWSAEYKRFMGNGKVAPATPAQDPPVVADSNDFPMDQILAKWQESCLDTELADPSMLPSPHLAELVKVMFKQLDPGVITFPQFVEYLSKAVRASGLPWSVVFKKTSSSNIVDEPACEFSFQPSISKESSELAWRLGRGTRRIEEVLLAAGEKYKTKAAQRKEAFEKQQAASLPFKPTLLTDNSNIEHRYPNEGAAEKFMEQIALLDRTREMLSAHTTTNSVRSSIGSVSTILSKPTVTRELNLEATNTLLSYTLSATADNQLAADTLCKAE